MRNVHKFSLTVTSVLIISGITTTTLAEDDNQLANARALSPLFACTTIEQNEARLNCQDQAIKKLQDASKSNQLAVIDEKAAKVIQKKSFGLSLPNLGIPGFRRESDKPKAVFLNVSSLQKTGGRLTITMQDGQVWRTIESGHGRIPKGDNLEAKIKSASFGSFLLSLSDGRKKSNTVRARRVK